jgi:transporter, SSS family
MIRKISLIIIAISLWAPIKGASKEYISIKWGDCSNESAISEGINKDGDGDVLKFFNDIVKPLNDGIIFQDGNECFSITQGAESKYVLSIYYNYLVTENRTLKSWQIPTNSSQKVAAATVFGSTAYVLLYDTINFANQLKSMSLNSGTHDWQEIGTSTANNIKSGCSVVQNNGNEDVWYIFGEKSFTYSFRSKKWDELDMNNGQLPNEDMNLLANNAALPLGTHNILLMGATEDILIYHTVTGQWHIIDKLPVKASSKNELFLLKNKYYLAGDDSICPFEIMNNGGFGTTNYIILLLYFVLMIAIGVYFSKKTKSSKEFFIGNGKIPWWAVGISIFATTLSAITFMAIPAKTFISNWLYFPMSFSIILVAPIVIKWYLPFFRTLNLTSAYEYLEKRFNLATRLFASAFFILFMVTRIAIVLYLPSLALSTVTGADIYLCVGLTSVITLIYSTLGGVEAVIWGDVLQGIILIGGAILAVIIIIFDTGGLNETITIAQNADKFKILDFSLNLKEPTFWVIFFGAGIANSLITYTSDQTIVQRYLTTEDEKKASKSIWLNGLISLPVLVLFYFIGTALYSFYYKNPSLLPYTMQNAEGIFPYFIINQMPSGLAGLLIAAIFASTMSTLSSNINSASTAFTCDFINRFNTSMTDNRRLSIARLTGIIVCFLGTAIAVWLSQLSVKSFFDTFNTFIGLFTSGLGALFLIGIFFPSINGRTVLISVILCNLLLFSIIDLNIVNFMMFGLLGIILTIVIAFILSPFLKEKSRNLDGLCWKHRGHKR